MVNDKRLFEKGIKRQQIVAIHLSLTTEAGGRLCQRSPIIWRRTNFFFSVFAIYTLVVRNLFAHIAAATVAEAALSFLVVWFTVDSAGSESE